MSTQSLPIEYIDRSGNIVVRSFGKYRTRLAGHGKKVVIEWSGCARREAKNAGLRTPAARTH